jgi:hypothetical protein
MTGCGSVTPGFQTVSDSARMTSSSISSMMVSSRPVKLLSGN